MDKMNTDDIVKLKHIVETSHAIICDELCVGCSFHEVGETCALEWASDTLEEMLEGEKW